MSDDVKRLNLFSYFGLVTSIHAMLFLSMWIVWYGTLHSVFFYLFFSLSLITPFAGLVLSIKGYLNSKKMENKGFGASLAGIVISSIGATIIAFLAFSLIGHMFFVSQYSVPDQTLRTHNSSELQSLQEEWDKMEMSRKGYPEGYPEKPLEDYFHLTLESDYAITRDDHEGFKNLGWIIVRNGRQVLDRNAAGELVLEPSLQWIHGEDGEFEIYLTAYIDGEYRRVSNIIKYTHMPEES